jgi:hypothetical protein
MSKRRAVAERRAEPSGTAPIDEPAGVLPQSQLEGDELLTWLCDRDLSPGEDELAAVELTAADCISDVPFHHYFLYDGHLDRASVDDVRDYFKRHDPSAVLSDDGARLNGLYRERAVREGLPLARSGMGEHLLDVNLG